MSDGGPVGYVVIGRNEGERLGRCLASLPGGGAAAIYVDSGSTDGSPDIARRAGADVVALTSDQPFSAARARNAGLQRLCETRPKAGYVMFIDGDSEIAFDWPGAAAQFLDDHRDVAAVCGRVRERFPEASLYNRLCDIEWDAPPGESLACGGIAMMRIGAVNDSGGFNPTLAGGEEPELCLRMRERGWKIWRLDRDMAKHDAAMTTFAQWFARMRRGGRAYVEVSTLHKASPARIWARETRRSLLWAAVLPAALLAAVLVHPAGLVLLAAYPLQIVRLATVGRARLPRRAQDHAWSYGLFMTIAKFAEAAGIVSYLVSAQRRDAPR